MMSMGARTIIGTVCVTTRMGYTHLRTTGKASITTPSSRPKARAMTMPSAASESVTSAWGKSVPTSANSASITSMGPGST